jgi:ubiquitin C-terminal hydrolase
MSTGQGPIAPQTMKRSLGEYDRDFADDGPNDSTNFLRILLNALHGDLNQSRVARGEKIALDNYREMERTRLCDQSKIRELFYLESKTTIKYDCGYQEKDEERSCL